jgi:16S rRNA G1207 methylase RsmC
VSEPPEHYFSAEPATAAVHRPVQVRAWGTESTLISVSGTFSAGRLDPGTAVLFAKGAPDPAARVMLDVGCGYGPITVALAQALPQAHVWAVDVNARARQACQANVERLGLADRVTVVPPEQVPAGVTFDEVWSNPPIRIGKAALHEVLLTWLGRLDPAGRGWLVVARHLGADSLQRWLTEQGHRTHRAASAKGYRVLRVDA